MSKKIGVNFGAFESKCGSEVGSCASTLDSTMASHGSDAVLPHKATAKPHGDLPQNPLTGRLPFMFETHKMINLTDFSMPTEYRDAVYATG